MGVIRGIAVIFWATADGVTRAGRGCSNLRMGFVKQEMSLFPLSVIMHYIERVLARNAFPNSFNRSATTCRYRTRCDYGRDVAEAQVADKVTSAENIKCWEIVT